MKILLEGVSIAQENMEDLKKAIKENNLYEFN
jgi:hypothetical protein